MSSTTARYWQQGADNRVLSNSNRGGRGLRIGSLSMDSDDIWMAGAISGKVQRPDVWRYLWKFIHGW